MTPLDLRERESIISDLVEGNFGGMHGMEAKLQGVKRGVRGEKVKTVGAGRMFQDLGGKGRREIGQSLELDKGSIVGFLRIGEMLACLKAERKEFKKRVRLIM